MAQPTYQGRITVGQDALDIGLSTLMVVVQDDATRVVAYVPRVGMVAVALQEGAVGTISDRQYLTGATATTANLGLSLMDRDGNDFVIVASSGAGALTGYEIDSLGRFATAETVTGIFAPVGGVVSLAQTTDGSVYAARTNGFLSHFQPNAQGNYSSGTASISFDNPVALTVARVGNSEFLLAASLDVGGVAAFRLNAQSGQPEPTSIIGTDSGLGIMVPSALDVVVLLGKTYVVLLSTAADGGTGGALSVMELTPSGTLVPRDHAVDTQLTRFGQANSLDMIEVNGRVYVVAGGGDDGMSLFELTPDGRLLHHASIANDDLNGLDNVSALVAAHLGDEVQILTTSQTAAGIGQWSFSVKSQTAATQASSSGGTLNGSAGNDLLAGGAGNDRLVGLAGDDILVGGVGRDTLVGGAGRDVFMLEPDDTSDLILDFTVGQDRLDLSRFRMLYSPAQIGFTPTATGAQLVWFEQNITILRDGGGSLSLADLFPNGFDWATHMALPSEFIGDGLADGGATNGSGYNDESVDGGGLGGEVTGNSQGGEGSGGGTTGGTSGEAGGSGTNTPPKEPTPSSTAGLTINGSSSADIIYGQELDDRLNGEGGNDEVYGRAGNDRINGGDGDDLLRGDNGDDYLHGSSGNDTVSGGAGNDEVIGGSGDDNVSGGDGNDTLTGGNGDDTLNAGGGDDQIFAQAGDDVVSGGNGRDSVHLGIGSDVYIGDGSGSDTVRGLAGHDTITGGSDGDLLMGHLGHDVIDGAGGDDTIQGGIGHDRLSGDDGNDLLDAAPGWDTLNGGAGDDTLIGSLGNDEMTGGTGADTFVFTARSGWDTVTDYQDGIDILNITYQNTSYNKLLITQEGADVTIWYGSGGIVLENTHISEITADDFVFG